MTVRASQGFVQLLAASVVMIVVMQLVMGVAALDLLLFSTTVLGLIVLPGVSLYLCAREGDISAIAVLGHGTSIGFALFTLSFLLGKISGMPFVTVAVPTAVLLGCLLRLNGIRIRFVVSESPGRIIWLVLLMVTIIIIWYVMKPFLLTALPGHGVTSYHHDVNWNIAVIAEIAHRWPLRDPVWPLEQLVYHFFGLASVAAVTSITAIDPFVVYLRLFQPVVLAVVALQVYAIATEMHGNHRHGIAAIALLFLAGESVPAHGHLFTYIMPDLLATNPSFALAVSYLLFALHIWYRVRCDLLETGATFWILSSLFAPVAFLLAGTKAPATILLLVGMGAGVLHAMAARTVRRPEMILFAVGLIASVLALAVLRPTEPGYQSDDWMTIYPFARDMASTFFKTLFPDGGGSPYLLLPFLPIIYLGAHGVRILLAVWPDSTGRHQLRLVKLPLFAMMAAGLISGMLLRSRWGEEGYFVHYGAIPMVLIAAGSVDAVRRAYRTRRFKLLRIGLVVVLFGTFLETAVNVIGAFSWFYRSAPMYVDVINEDRYEVYRWLREHTQVNEVITTLPRSAMDYSSSSLSERRVLIGGWYYNSSARRWNSGGFYASDAIEQNPGERTAADMEHALQVGDSNRIITLMRRAGSKHIVLLKSDYARIAETGAFTLVHRNGSYAAFSVSSDTVRQK